MKKEIDQSAVGEKRKRDVFEAHENVSAVDPAAHSEKVLKITTLENQPLEVTQAVSVPFVDLDVSLCWIFELA
ncbi:hypothetical protein L195_g041472 [Trifolium pratense]|uniref:Uncharacterized protein n=1 Tax=Trifolium pratense TaxID=57577 RepID=A0A2K3M3R2_TRIPR|nr:hypothetical protein L195_g041472 [Trifolium pratense]